MDFAVEAESNEARRQETEQSLAKLKTETEHICREMLFSWQWENGFKCPKCGQAFDREMVKQKMMKSKSGRFNCPNPQCRHQTTVTSETCFRGTRMDIRELFICVAALGRLDRSTQSLNSLHRILYFTDDSPFAHKKRTYSTLWRLHRNLQHTREHPPCRELVNSIVSFVPEIIDKIHEERELWDDLLDLDMEVQRRDQVPVR